MVDTLDTLASIREDISTILIQEGAMEVLVLKGGRLKTYKSVDFFAKSNILDIAKMIAFMSDAVQENHSMLFGNALGEPGFEGVLSDNLQKIAIFSPKKGITIVSRIGPMVDEEKIIGIMKRFFQSE